jgi:polysaccharide pyruvyl transferase WcaK-like protein
MGMKRIGIITFHRSHNYGAALQAYALLTTLRDMGHNAEIIDYWPESRAGEYAVFKMPNRRTIKSLIKSVILIFFRWKANSKFNRFMKRHLNIQGNSFHLGINTPGDYDMIVCGSDQIWRYNFRGLYGFDDFYFAKYPLNKKVLKVSYAPSMGDEDIEKDAKKSLSKLLENFDSISVREDSLLDLVASLTTKPVVKVLDPVFLLTAPEWRKMIKSKPPKKKYLLFYQLLQNADARNLAKKIAEERGLEIIQINGMNRNANPFGLGTMKLSAGPLDFISLVAHADYVVSTSYHGVAFAIIFQRPFAALGFKNKSSRTKSLLKTLDIEKCFVQENSPNYCGDVDYTLVHMKLNELIKNSHSFLSDNVSKLESQKPDIEVMSQRIHSL